VAGSVQVPHSRKWRDRQRTLSRQRWLLFGFILALAVLAIARRAAPTAFSPIDIGRFNTDMCCFVVQQSLEGWHLNTAGQNCITSASRMVQKTA
jgi:hypothetical protein